MDRTKKAWINGLFLIVTLIVNALGAIGLINGLSQKEISDMYITLITPSPSTFSIWSVIYALLLTSLVVMIARKNDPYYTRAIDQISGLFRISCLFNIAWIVAFSFVQIELSVLFIFGFLITLTSVCQKLMKIQDKNRWLLPLTFGMYTGWLFIATVVNISAALVKLNWQGFGIANETWSVLTLVTAVILVFGVLSKIRNAAFPLPIAWAYFGIHQFLRSPEGFSGAYGLLQTITLAGMLALMGLAALQFFKNHFSLLPISAEQESDPN